MIIIKKKNVLQELALSLFLMLEFNPDTTPLSLSKRVREKAKDALDAAEVYTGEMGTKEVEAFLASKPLHFSIDCRDDVVKGDIIRFTEQVYNNCRKPPRHIGKRGIVAEVLNVKTGSNSMLHLRVITSGGAWELAPETEIYRTIKIITRTEVMRTRWKDEEKRERIRTAQEQPLPQIMTATDQLVRWGGKLKDKGG